jgi:Prokaryotic phospholipase A2
MVKRPRACQRGVVMSGRAASTAGQATIEYLAIAAGVVALAAPLAVVTPSLGEKVAGTFACVIDRVGGGGGTCGSPSGSAEAATPVDDGLSERERAARDLQPGIYDDVPGTAQERIATSTPPPPAGDQCTASPDKVPGLYDFSYGCYAHDLCWQNGSIGGRPMTIGACNDEFRRRMRDHCDRRNTGFGSGVRENACFDVADTYFAAVSAAGIAKAVHDCPRLAATLGPTLALAYACRPQ